jgi:FkbM family methyltransferase
VNQIFHNKTFFEIDTLEFIRSRNLAGVYLDVGAHIGNHTLYFLNETKAQHVISVEGNETICRLLSENLAANIAARGKTVKIENRFVSSEKELFFNPDHGNNSGASFLTAIRIGNASKKVEACKLDRLVPATSNVALVKIDVERHELEVLRSAPEILTRCRPELCIELFQVRTSQLSGYLSGFDYLPLVSLPNGNTYFVTFPHWLVSAIVLLAKRLPEAISSRLCWRVVRGFAVISGRLSISDLRRPVQSYAFD